MPTVKSKDGTELHVKDWGNGRPVILIHGWPLSADSWDEQAMALVNAGFRTIAYDRRGFGRSAQPWSGYDYDTLADDLAAVIEQTGAQDVSLVGFSMGGGEIARYMSRHAGKSVTRAALISSIVPYMLKTQSNPHGTDSGVFEKMANAIDEDRAKFFSSFFKDFFGVGVLTKPVSDAYIDWNRSVAMQASLQATLECAKSFSTTDFRPDLPSFNIPTLVIHGTGDATVPMDAAGRAAAAGIRQATLIEYEGAPHGLYATERQRLTKDLLAFLK